MLCLAKDHVQWGWAAVEAGYRARLQARFCGYCLFGRVKGHVQQELAIAEVGCRTDGVAAGELQRHYLTL